LSLVIPRRFFLRRFYGQRRFFLRRFYGQNMGWKIHVINDPGN